MQKRSSLKILTITKPYTLGSLRRDLITRLKEYSPSPALDADCILKQVLKISREEIFLNPGFPVSKKQYRKINRYFSKRKKGLPIAYITGKKEFYGYDFYVSRSVLIPKPDTEILVEKALERAGESFPKDKTIRVLDLCTGSGAIGISFFLEAANREISCEMILSDISAKALKVCRKNLKFHSAREPSLNKRTRILKGNLLNPILKTFGKESFDMILTNPPYVPEKTSRELLKDGRAEPFLALNGGTDGLDLIRKLIPDAQSLLVPGGLIFLESGETQTETISRYFLDNDFCSIIRHKDLEGQFRVTEARKQ